MLHRFRLDRYINYPDIKIVSRNGYPIEILDFDNDSIRVKLTIKGAEKIYNVSRCGIYKRGQLSNYDIFMTGDNRANRERKVSMGCCVSQYTAIRLYELKKGLRIGEIIDKLVKEYESI